MGEKNSFRSGANKELNTQHIRGKPDGNGFFGAVLPTGSAVPAFIRIFKIRHIFVIRIGKCQINGIGGTNGITYTAPGTSIHVENRGQFISSQTYVASLSSIAHPTFNF
jgi:hypothetical protein